MTVGKTERRQFSRSIYILSAVILIGIALVVSIAVVSRLQVTKLGYDEIKFGFIQPSVNHGIVVHYDVVDHGEINKVYWRMIGVPKIISSK